MNHLAILFLKENDYFVNFSLFFCHFSRFLEIFVFRIVTTFFSNAWIFARPGIDIIENGEACIYFFNQFWKFGKFWIFVIFQHFRWSNLIVIRFFYSSRGLRVENVSVTTHLYMGKKYAYRKRIVKHISNLHFSDRKNANVFEPKN